MTRLTRGFVIAMLPWLWFAEGYADGTGERAGLCDLPSRYCSATTALAACIEDLTFHPGGDCRPIAANCNLGPGRDSAYSIRYQGNNHHVYKFYPPGCPDADGDGLANEFDPDDDNDGVNDADDRCPLESASQGTTDPDGDGCWSFTSTATYHAGTCPTDFAGLPFGHSLLRYRGFQSYRLQSGHRSDASTSGFYADDIVDAVILGWVYLQTASVIYVPGHHRHGATSTCTLPRVSRARFDALRSRAQRIVWTDYHLVLRNGQHWAAEVVKPNAAASRKSHSGVQP